MQIVQTFCNANEVLAYLIQGLSMSHVYSKIIMYTFLSLYSS